MLARLRCQTVGCELTLEYEGSRVFGRCLRCGQVTEGWTYGESPKLVPGTQPYWDALYDECQAVELSLHGGG